uniref:Pleckstrin homology domain containing B1 n=1 Tax=Ursus maritimus TaxID=29073 RepID=A0A452TZL6_URSMA
MSEGSILRRWKRNWFALWLDGTLGYYHDETAQDEEDRVLIQFNVRDIKIGQECQDVQPPEGRSRDGLLTVNLREGPRLHLCAETKDDAVAWKTALLEANSTPVRVYSPYQDYYEVVPPNAHEATYIRSYYGPPYAGKSPAWSAPSPDTAPGPTLVVTTDFPRRDPPLGPSHPETRNTSWTSGPPHSVQLTSPLRAGPFSLAVLQYPFLSWWRPLVAKCWNGRLLRPLGLAVGNTHPLVCPEGSWRPRSFLAVAP